MPTNKRKMAGSQVIYMKMQISGLMTNEGLLNSVNSFGRYEIKHYLCKNYKRK